MVFAMMLLDVAQRAVAVEALVVNAHQEHLRGLRIGMGFGAALSTSEYVALSILANRVAADRTRLARISGRHVDQAHPAFRRLEFKAFGKQAANP